jgi:glycosyltransferase involved in cell wall biosynthesis
MSIKISLGLPVFNEVKFLDLTLQSILAQTYEEFELIIVDNASTDGSFELLQKIAKKDTRVKLFRNEKNLGGNKNFNLTFKYSSGNYFMWIGAHDIYENDYLALLIQKLKEGNFSYDLVFSNVSNIDSEGKIIQKKKEVGFEFNNSNLITRMIKLPWVIKGSGDMVMGLFSRKALERTSIFSENVLWPDNLLIHQISSMGNIGRVEQVLRARRYFREEKFNNWNKKYLHLVNRYKSSRGERKIGIMLRLPIFSMFLLIIYRIGIVNMLRNPLMLFFSLYIATIYLWKHRVPLWIDLSMLFSSTQS